MIAVRVTDWASSPSDMGRRIEPTTGQTKEHDCKAERSNHPVTVEVKQIPG